MDKAMLLRQTLRPVKTDIDGTSLQVRNLRAQRVHGALQSKALSHTQ